MKLFGRDLWNYRGTPGVMYDFAQHGLVNLPVMMAPIPYATGQWNMNITMAGRTEQATVSFPEPPAPELATPVAIWEAGGLNAKKFEINCDPDYVNMQLALAQDKLNLITGKSEKKKTQENMMFMGGGVRYGVEELESIIERLRNRLKVKFIPTDFPYTTNELINEMLGKHTLLSCKRADEFVPDLPKEAIQAMTEYNKLCVQLCNKETVFYVVADQKDFVQKNKRRDPILLAQSPFGFFWSILGAWDSLTGLDEL